MHITLEQTFPLGRFHATPWKVFPYDDPHGEWPPSPWRLVRAVLARSYQLDREITDSTEAHAVLRSELVHAFATSQVEWHLPPSSWRGPGLRQYQPVEFDWGYAQPAKKTLITLSEDLAASLGGAYGLQEKGEPDSVEVFDDALRSLGFRTVTSEQLDNLKKLVEALKKPNAPKPRKLKRYPPDARSYGTSKVLDNFWITAHGTAAPILWHFDGPDWTPPLLAHLDACLARMTYFGRAESITEIRRIETASSSDDLVKLSPCRSGKAVPVLSLQPDATLVQLEATTDVPSVKDTNIPPGSRWMFAERPARPRILPAKQPIPELPPTNLIQFAIGCRVDPRYSEAVRLTERFRSRVLGRFAEYMSGFRLKRGWAEASDKVKQKAALLSGKGVTGEALKGHDHAFFFLHGEPDKPTRLCLWRKEPFTNDEQHAILSAASHPLPLSYNDDPWTITLVPLDRMVQAPAGFSAQPALHWKTLTPWVPPRHALDRKGRTKPGHGLEQQIREELAGWDMPAIQDINIYKTGWVKSHLPSKSKVGRSNTNKLGYEVRLTFKAPFVGPLMIGHSAHFGLGLFAPAE